jgi:hypothetical protein
VWLLDLPEQHEPVLRVKCLGFSARPQHWCSVGSARWRWWRCCTSWRVTYGGAEGQRATWASWLVTTRWKAVLTGLRAPENHHAGEPHHPVNQTFCRMVGLSARRTGPDQSFVITGTKAVAPMRANPARRQQPLLKGHDLVFHAPDGAVFRLLIRHR